MGLDVQNCVIFCAIAAGLESHAFPVTKPRKAAPMLIMTVETIKRRAIFLILRCLRLKSSCDPEHEASSSSLIGT